MFNVKVLSGIQKNKRVYVFIDSANIWAINKTKKYFLDLAKVKSKIIETFQPKTLKIFYYVACPEQKYRHYDVSKKIKYLDWLRKGLDFGIVFKILKRIKINHGENDLFEEKGNMDVEIAVDSVDKIGEYDIFILFSGDSDFRYLINKLIKRKKRVYIVSSENNISKELRNINGGYCDIAKIQGVWGREMCKRK